MEEKGLLSLPEEILIHLASFLDLKALLACSATCSYLRSVLNSNSIWKQYYRSNIVNYINNAKSFVKPEFQYPDVGQSLEKLCDERINLLRQNFLLNNWRQGRCVSNEAPIPWNGVFLENNDRQIIFRNVYLFLPAVNRNEINIWSIEEVPYFYTKVEFNFYEYNLENEPWTDMVSVWYQIINDNLVIIQGNLIQIFHINLPSKKLPLKNLISVDRDEAVSDFAESLYIDCHSWIVGHLLFSRLCYLPVVHVWNILTGTKLKALRAPTTGWNLYVISLDDMDNVVFNLRTDDELDTEHGDYAKITNFVYSYSFSKDEYSTIFPNLIGCKPVRAMHYRSILVLFCIDDMFVFSCSIYVFDCESSTVTAHETFTDLIGLYKSHIVEDRLILATQNSVKIMNVKSLEVLQSLKIDDIIDIDYLPLFNASFLVSSTLKNNIELWDVNKNQILLKIPLQCFVFLNESCTKLIMVSGQTLIVKNFW